MPDAIERSGKVFQGENAPILDRIVARGVPLVEADVNSFTIRAFDSSDDRNGRRILDAVDPSGYWFDTLQTNQGWDRDTRGFNFAVTITPTHLKVLGDHTVRYEIIFDTVAYGKIASVWKITYLGLESL